MSTLPTSIQATFPLNTRRADLSPPTRPPARLFKRGLRADHDEAFFDDLDLGARDRKEEEADAWAEEALIPAEVWRNHPLRVVATLGGVINLAQQLQIHPAIIAGRVRHEQRNFRLLSQFVGTGEVRPLFPDANPKGWKQ